MKMISTTHLIQSHDHLVNLILTINCFAFTAFLIILPLTIIFMLPLQDLLNKSETKPDWKVKEEQENQRKDDELIRRLIYQAHLEMHKITRKQRDVYDNTFPDKARLTPELIEHFHNRPLSVLYYTMHYTTQKLYPNIENHTGPSNMPVRSIDYLNVGKIRWF